VVYVDPNVFNYTELNDAIKIANDSGLYGDRLVIDPGGNSCIKQIPYMICQSVYPRCNSTTQALLPVCTSNCMKNFDSCSFAFNALSVSNAINVNPIFELLIINCTNQFRAFESVSVDSANCYSLYGKL